MCATPANALGKKLDPFPELSPIPELDPVPEPDSVPGFKVAALQASNDVRNPC